MATHSSATARSETPHATNSIKNNLNRKPENTFSDALKRRAQSFINNKSIDAGTRAVLRYALETNDPWLPELARRADADEPILDNLCVPQTPQTSNDDSSEEKVAVLVEIICRDGNEPATKSAALLVLMATFENATDPKALANTVKHLAFTRCGELNPFGTVDAQIAVLEGELLAGNTLVS